MQNFSYFDKKESTSLADKWNPTVISRSSKHGLCLITRLPFLERYLLLINSLLGAGVISVLSAVSSMKIPYSLNASLPFIMSCPVGISYYLSLDPLGFRCEPLFLFVSIVIRVGQRKTVVGQISFNRLFISSILVPNSLYVSLAYLTMSSR